MRASATIRPFVMTDNTRNPRIEIDPRPVEIRIDGEPLPPLPDEDLPLNRRYFLV